jgi:hypothetical protein
MPDSFDIHLEGADRLVAQFDHMLDELEESHEKMQDVLVAWQTEDMKRKYPNLQVKQAGNTVSVRTMIWPRSRRERPKKEFLKYIKQARRGRLGPRKYVPGGQAAAPTPSRRPILRQVLVDKLHDRMTTEVLGEIKWQ